MPGMIKKEDIEKVRATADLYDIVSATVTLKPSGTGTYVGLCPFHDEKTPSFSVRPALGVWHCFGCGLGGDVFGYVEHQENIDFRDAVELLADKYHIELHYDKADNVPAHTGSKRARLLEANEAAQEYFVSQLMTKEALAARKLLDGRNFSQADCQRFGCGYAPQGWDNLVRHLAGKGFTQQEMLDAGLARQGQRGVYDYFRGRVTWPIRDSTGRTLGFGARKLYEDDTINAKYINTPDTQLYRKTQVLYGIDLAKSAIVKKRQAVIVEGYTDVIHVPINKSGSSTYNNALMAQGMLREERPEHHMKIHLLDPHTYSMVFGWYLCEMARKLKNGAEISHVIQEFEKQMNCMEIILGPYSLKQMKKSGRISAAAAVMGELMGVRPIITLIDGKTKVESKVRGDDKVVPAMIELCKKRADGVENFDYMIGHTNIKQAEDLEKACRKAFGKAPLVVFELGGVVSANTGPDTVALVYTGHPRG